MAEQSTQEAKSDAAHVEQAAPNTYGGHGLDINSVAEDAQRATEEEHQIGFFEGVRRYPKACAWSMVVSLCIIMDGYDTALIGSLFAFPAFQKKFGHPVGNGKYQLHANWQIALGLAGTVGNICGIFLNALFTERYGHKKVLLGTLVILTGLIFIPFFAPNVQILFLGEILSGLPWGVFTTMAPAYASEVCPVVLRGYLETFVVLCWGIGQFVSYGVLDSLNKNTTNWAWRIPFAVQWVWPIIIFPLVCFAPESPWWLVRKGRYQEAEHSVVRLSASSKRDDAKKAVALMIETNNLEQELNNGTTYWECFAGSNLWRTEISCVSWSIQVWASFVIMSYATYFFEQAGLSSSDAYKMTVGIGGLHFVCTLSSTFLTGNFGRRTIFFWGLVCMTSLMFIIGFLSLAKQNTALGYAQSAVYLLWFCGYELSIGPVAYIIVGETSATRLRSKTVGLARNAYNVASVINYVVAPYILNPTEGNWKGKAGFLAGGLSTLATIWTFFRLPECKGRTYQELDILFSEKGLTARNFKQQIVNVRSDMANIMERKPSQPRDDE